MAADDVTDVVLCGEVLFEMFRGEVSDSDKDVKELAVVW